MGSGTDLGFGFEVVALYVLPALVSTRLDEFENATEPDDSQGLLGCGSVSDDSRNSIWFFTSLVNRDNLGSAKRGSNRL